MKLISALLAAATIWVVTISAKCVPGTSTAKVDRKDSDGCPDNYMPSARFVRGMAAWTEDPINNNQDGTHNSEEQAEIHCITELMSMLNGG
ncbi:hypothetical protein PMIN04_003986 [Paraphaeosphaeria minitans]